MKKVNLTIEEYGNIWGPRKTKTYDLIRQGRLQKVKIDGMTYITVESAEALHEQSIVRKGGA